MIIILIIGNNVAIGKRKGMKYDGNHGEMDNEFRIELIKLIELLLSPKNLVTKKINRKKLTSTEYFEYVKNYLINFQSRELPKPQTIYESTVKKQLSIVIESCLEEYKNGAEAKQCIINEIEHIPIFNKMITDTVMLKYYESNKMGNKQHHHKFKNILLMNINSEFKNWSKEVNEKITTCTLENQRKIERINAEINQLKIDNDEAQKELFSKNQALDELKKSFEDELAASKLKLEKLKVELETLKNEKDELEILNEAQKELFSKNQALGEQKKSFEDVLAFQSDIFSKGE